MTEEKDKESIIEGANRVAAILFPVQFTMFKSDGTTEVRNNFAFADSLE